MSKQAVRAALAGALLAALCLPASQSRAAPSAPAPLALPSPETLSRLGINAAALSELLKRGAASHSDAVVIVKNDEVVGQWYFGKTPAPIETMSATKSVAALAVGCLIHDGKIKSLDEPVSDFYPEWKQGRKKLITVRQILNHTSGLQADATTEEIYASPDFVQLALAAELSSAPGKTFFYNNKAVNFLSGIVNKASGQTLEDYTKSRIFAPLGITDYHWDTDKAGNTQVFAGLQLHALDLAKIGQMLADGGVWKGTRIVDRQWITEMTQPGQTLSPSCGLLWWLLHSWTKGEITPALLASWRQAGVPAVYLARVKPLQGRRFDRPALFAEEQAIFGSADNMVKQLRDKQLRPMQTVAGPTVGYFADGYLGQYLVVVPKEHLVAVRQISSGSFKSDQTDNFDDFMVLVPALVGEKVAGD